LLLYAWRKDWNLRNMDRVFKFVDYW
jgi:hypothetical protein